MRALAVACALVLAAQPARLLAQTVTTPVAAGSKARADIALVRVEPLGLDAERAARLEALFRLELERLAGAPMPSRGAVEKAIGNDAALRACTGEPECLTAIGKKLGVKQVVSGNVGELGDSYVLNLKLVDVTTGNEVRRVSEPLRGSPDELIEAMRVAAYRLAAPDRLLGSVTILSPVRGADVYLDGKHVGKTPLAKPIANVTVGTHKLRLTSKGYTDFLSDVEVRFQKSTQVEVRMVKADVKGSPIVDDGRPRPAPTPWYSSTWGYVGVGVGAVLLGVLIGSAIGGQDTINCSKNPEECAP